MPSIPIPLRAGDTDAQLNLKAVLHHAYEVGGYEDYIYSGPLEPRLAPDDMTWASQFLPTK